MNEVEKSNKTGLLMLIDFEKAFDSLSWKFLELTLALFKFGPSFKKWIQIINKDIVAYAIQCGIFSEPISIKRGCRQGDPIAPYLFLLPAELLSALILQNPQIKGIKIGGFEYKLAQYADDTTLLLDGSQSSLSAALNVLEVFGTLSGLKMNKQKTKLIWLGRKKHSKDKLCDEYNLNWGVTEFTLLGIEYSVNLELMTHINYEKAYKLILADITKWSKRNITPIGKITLIKSLFLSKINHILTVLPTPSGDYIVKLEKLFFSYIWDKKPDKIKRSIIKRNYNEGGLNMPDIDSVFKASKTIWIKRLLYQSALWTNLFNNTICSIDSLTKFGRNWFMKVAKNTDNTFWRDVLTSYSVLIDSMQIKSNINLIQSPIWYNHEIFTYNFHLKTWSTIGILFVGDIINDSGKLKSFNILKSEFNSNSIKIFDYNRVASAVNKYIKDNKKGESFSQNKPFIPNHINDLFKFKKGTKHLRIILSKKLTMDTECTSKHKWEQELHQTLNEQSWKSVFNIAFNTINNNYHKYFQYKIIHRTLGTNYLLSKMNISNSASCRLCFQEDETNLHLFAKCKFSKTLWSDISNWLKLNYNITIEFDERTVILGYILNNNIKLQINTIIITAKKYIFHTAQTNTLPIFSIFKKKLRYIYFEEKALAEINSKTETFDKNWHKLKKEFD